MAAIRRYPGADLNAVYDVCVRTADAGAVEGQGEGNVVYLGRAL